MSETPAVVRLAHERNRERVMSATKHTFLLQSRGALHGTEHGVERKRCIGRDRHLPSAAETGEQEIMPPTSATMIPGTVTPRQRFPAERDISIQKRHRAHLVSSFRLLKLRQSHLIELALHQCAAILNGCTWIRTLLIPMSCKLTHRPVHLILTPEPPVAQEPHPG